MKLSERLIEQLKPYVRMSDKSYKLSIERHAHLIKQDILALLPEKKFLYSEENGGMKFENEEYSWYNQAREDIKQRLEEYCE